MESAGMHPFLWRIKMFVLRFIDYILHIPIRLYRFLKCAFGFHSFYGKHGFARWLCGSIILLIDITPASVIYECLLDWFKMKTRPINDSERLLAESIFQNRLPYDLIGMDSQSLAVKRKIAMAFATLHTINYYHTITAHTFIHELVHVWQYRQFGALYITEAIWAQRWGGGYNYGGIEPLKMHANVPGLRAFNFEQQAEIVEDYFRLTNGLPMQWSAPHDGLENLLRQYVNEIRIGKQKDHLLHLPR